MDKLEQDLIKFLKDYLKESGKDGYTLGVSGGLDSAICAKLLIKGNIPATFVIMPCGDSMEESEERAYLSIQYGELNFDYSIHYIDIESTVSIYDRILSVRNIDNYKDYDWAMKNLQSRVRANYLYTIAQSKNQLVLGTTNKSENFIGYFTKGGDGLVDLEPLLNIPKTYLFKFAEFIGVHKSIIEAAPAAELGISKTDEEEMGYTYEQLDKCIEDFENNTLRDNSIQRKIMNDHYKSEFKRHMSKSFEFKMQ